MGQDKGAMKVGSSSMLEHSTSLLNALNLDKVVVSGANFDIPDIFVNKGPVGGIYSAIMHLGLRSGDIIVIVPNDMPFMRAELLSQLLQQSLEHKCSFIFQDHPMPLSLVISDKILAQCEGLADAKGMSVKKLISVDKVGELALESEGANVFSNVNTPQELARAVDSYQYNPE